MAGMLEHFLTTFHATASKLVSDASDMSIGLTGHIASRDDIEKKLSSMNKGGLEAYAKEHNCGTEIKIPESLDIFPIEKKKAVECILNDFDNKSAHDPILVAFTKGSPSERTETFLQKLVSVCSPPFDTDSILVENDDQGDTLGSLADLQEPVKVSCDIMI